MKLCLSNFCKEVYSEHYYKFEHSYKEGQSKHSYKEIHSEHFYKEVHSDHSYEEVHSELSELQRNLF